MRAYFIFCVALTIAAGIGRGQGGTPGLRIDSAIQTGFLFVPETREYQWRVTPGGAYTLQIDGAPVLGTDRVRDGGPVFAAVTLTAGEHPVAIEFRPRSEGARADLLWNGNHPFRFAAVPSTAFSPSRQSGFTWWMRSGSAHLIRAASLGWSALIVWLVGRALSRVVPLGGLEWSQSLWLTVAAVGLLTIVGLDWGAPGGRWAPDEFDPAYVLEGMRRGLSGERFVLYPPLHFYLLYAVYSPAVILAHVGWLDLDHPATENMLFLEGRLLSATLSVGVIVAVAALARRLAGATAAWGAALWLGLTVQFVFYSKTANAEIPYVFWFLISILFLISWRDSGARMQLLGFCVSAAFAVGTKDQAYALYAVPGGVLVWWLIKSGSVLNAVMAASAMIAAFSLVHNLPFDWQRFVDHVRLITGSASVDYRMFPPTPSGHVSLAAATIQQFLWIAGVPGLLLCLVGAGRMLGQRQSRLTLCVLVASAFSYYLLFIAVVGYVYDRFLLPVALMAAIPAGVGLASLLTARTAGRASRIVLIILLAWMAWRAVSVDALLLTDGRYGAEAWLERHVQAGHTVASLDQRGYLPRLEAFEHVTIRADVARTIELAPDFIVCNAEFMARFPPETGRGAWFRWLSSADSPYREVFRYKNPLRGSALRFTPAFTDRVEDPYINLDKANPETVIFQRK